MQDWVISVVESLGVFGVGLLMLLENVFPPLPSEVIMPLAGYLSVQGQMPLWGAIAAGAAGSLLGTTLWYFAGRAIGEQRLRGWVDAHGAWLTLTPEDIDKAKGFFQRHGGASVFFGRLVPVVRTLISVPAGFGRMPLTSFLLYSALGTVLWTAALAYAGRVLGEQFPQVGSYLGPVTWVIIGGALIWYIVRVIRIKRER